MCACELVEVNCLYFDAMWLQEAYNSSVKSYSHVYLYHICVGDTFIVCAAILPPRSSVTLAVSKRLGLPDRRQLDYTHKAAHNGTNSHELTIVQLVPPTSTFNMMSFMHA